MTMRPRASSRVLKREASFMKRILFSDLDTSCFTNNAGSLSSLPVFLLDLLLARGLPTKLSIRMRLLNTGFRCHFSSTGHQAYI